MTQRSRTLVIGIGNEYRADDAVGLHVARQLVRLAPPDCDVKELPGEGSQLLIAWQDYHRVVLVDAVRSRAQPGTIHRVNALDDVLPDNWIHHSAHTVSLQHAIDLARALNRLPEVLDVYGIEISNLNPGVGLSAEVRQAAERVAQSIFDEIGN